MQRFLVVTERASDNYSSYSPDLPGCVASDDRPEEAERNMRQAIQLHLEGMRQDNFPIPESQSSASYFAVP